MTTLRVPTPVLATEIRDGRVALFRIAGRAASGRLGGAIDTLAQAGLDKATATAFDGGSLEWPDACCKCMARGKPVTPVDSTSVVNKGVAYTFTFRLPHCPTCAPTANRKRGGDTSFFAIFLTIGVIATIGLLVLGLSLDSQILIAGSFVGGPVAGILLPWAWSALRPGQKGRGSGHQAIYASALDLTTTAVPTGFELTFENAAYASRFLTLNRTRGVTTD